MKRITVNLVINGEKCCATQIVEDIQWNDTGFRLALIKRMTRYLIDEATKGVEPRITVEECLADIPMGLRPLLPVKTDGTLDVESK